MAKKTKDETIDLLYLNNKQDVKSKSKAKVKNKNVPKKAVSKDQRINLDNEIIIGLTPKKKTSEQKKKTNIKKTSKKTVRNKNVKTKNSNKAVKVKKNSKKIKILKWTSLIILVIAMIILFMLSPIFNIKQIEVDGNSKLTKEEIVNLSQIKIDENTFKVKNNKVIDLIKSNNYVEKVTIKRELPSTIKIVIKERGPQYIIETIAGNAYIDAKGYILEVSPEKLDLPILTGYETEINSIIDFQNTKKLTDNDCKKLETVNEIIKTASANNVLIYITSIDILDNDDIKLFLASESKIAHLGDGSNANLRILYMKTMIEGEKGKEGDIFVNGDVTTLKPKPYFREKV